MISFIGTIGRVPFFSAGTRAIPGNPFVGALLFTMLPQCYIPLWIFVLDWCPDLWTGFCYDDFHHFWRLQRRRFILDILVCTMMVLHSCIAIWPISFTAFHNVQFRAFTSAYRYPFGGVGSIEVGNPISRMTNNNPAMQKE